MHAKSFSRVQLRDTMCSLLDSSAPGILQARILEGVHALLQGLFLTQELNPGLLRLLHCSWISAEPPGIPLGTYTPV